MSDRNNKINSIAYEFVRVNPADLPLLAEWLRHDHVRRWWGDPDRELGLIKDALSDTRTDMRIVYLNREPMAFIQDYDVHAWPQVHFAYLPQSSRAIDTFIGPVHMLGQSHGPRYLRQRAQELLREGAASVVIDPEVDNLRARKAYNKAGFFGENPVQLDHETVVLMIYSGDLEPD